MTQKQYSTTAGSAALHRIVIGALLLLLVCAMIAVPVAAKEQMVNNWDQLKEAFGDPSVDVITVTDDITMEEPISIIRKITLKTGDKCSNRYIKSHDIICPAFNVEKGGHLILGSNVADRTLTLKDNEKRSAVRVSGGTFTMKGGVISGNEASAYGGGVYVRNGTFTMKGGVISGNKASLFGGGVLIHNSTFTMEDGVISGSEARYCGGVYVLDSTFTMKGGVISGNKANDQDICGGGVLVHGNSTFTMDKGSIIGNNARGSGGGVYVLDSTFTMKGGTISNNKAHGLDGCGGGVYVRNDGTFTMKGGTISNNKAKHGGGVCVGERTKFTKEGGTISGNTPNNTEERRHMPPGVLSLTL